MSRRRRVFSKEEVEKIKTLMSEGIQTKKIALLIGRDENALGAFIRKNTNEHGEFQDRRINHIPKSTTSKITTARQRAAIKDRIRRTILGIDTLKKKLEKLRNQEKYEYEIE